jgi:transcriptional antiterminator RfaH
MKLKPENVNLSWHEQVNWFAVQTKPHQEGLAAAKVAELDVEVFLPRVKKEQLVCGIWRVVTTPLFPCYFFARFCPLLSLATIRYASGTLRVIGTSRFPIPLEPDSILNIKERIQADGLIHLEQKPLRRDDKVIIECGPFEGWVGRVLRESDDGRRVTVLLDMLERARVVMERQYLKPVAAAA